MTKSYLKDENERILVSPGGKYFYDDDCCCGVECACCIGGIDGVLMTILGVVDLDPANCTCSGANISECVETIIPDNDCLDLAADTLIDVITGCSSGPSTRDVSLNWIVVDNGSTCIFQATATIGDGGEPGTLSISQELIKGVPCEDLVTGEDSSIEFAGDDCDSSAATLTTALCR